MLKPGTRKPAADGVSPVERLHALVAADMNATDKMIHARMGSAVNLIPDLAKHLIDSGGKRLRPMLTLAAAQMGGYSGDKHINLAAAVEFIHTATLLHDDVVDASTLRRGKVAANLVWGNKATVLVGDFLFSRAFEMMVDTGSLRVLEILAGASAIIAEGEVMQLKSESNLGTTEEHYLKVVGAKTAALFAAAAEAGATLCDRGPEFINALRSYGDNLGIAFQLVDDALDDDGDGHCHPEDVDVHQRSALFEEADDAVLDAAARSRRGGEDHIKDVVQRGEHQRVVPFGAGAPLEGAGREDG